MEAAKQIDITKMENGLTSALHLELGATVTKNIVDRIIGLLEGQDLSVLFPENGDPHPEFHEQMLDVIVFEARVQRNSVGTHLLNIIIRAIKDHLHTLDESVNLDEKADELMAVLLRDMNCTKEWLAAVDRRTNLLAAVPDQVVEVTDLPKDMAIEDAILEAMLFKAVKSHEIEEVVEGDEKITRLKVTIAVDAEAVVDGILEFLEGRDLPSLFPKNVSPHPEFLKEMDDVIAFIEPTISEESRRHLLAIAVRVIKEGLYT